jgi:class 3 adenylate cyclase
VGSRDRLSYALIGDTVNLASRIQNLTKEARCEILASEATVSRLKGRVRIGRRFVKHVAGREAPVTVYEILPTSPDQSRIPRD